MARRQGIDISEGYDGKYYIGSRDELIAEGLVEPEWFPGEPGQRKTVGHGCRGDAKISIYTRGKAFQVLVRHTKQERDERDRRQAINETLQAVFPPFTQFAQHLFSTQPMDGSGMLDRLQMRILACNTLCSMAVLEISAKQLKRPDELKQSAKLWRAIENLDAARRNISEVIAGLQKLSSWELDGTVRAQD